MLVFLARLQALLKADVSIAEWNGDRVVVIEDLDTDDQALAISGDAPTMIVIHTPRHRESGCPEHPQQIGKECQRFQVIVTVVQRKAISVNGMGLTDPALVGEPGTPGVIQMQQDVHGAIVGPTGAWNLLPDSAGVDYLWYWELGEAGDPLLIDDEDYTYATSSRELVGHKWQFFY